MRHIYTLTDATRKVLTDNVAVVAAEMNVNTSYLYQILSGSETDAFSKFLAVYAACVRANVPVTDYDTALSAVKKRYRTPTDEKECLAAKITRDAETTSKWVAAARDGVIDDREAECLRTAIQRERDSLDELEGLLEPRHVPNVREFARDAIKARRNGRGK